MCPNRHSPDYPIEDSVNRHSIPHRHTVTMNKVSSQLTDKDSQPPVYQVGLGQRMYILPGYLWAMLCTCHPYLNIPGHQATRPSGRKLTANELGGIRFAGVGSKWFCLKPYFSVELFIIRKVTQATILTHFQTIS